MINRSLFVLFLLCPLAARAAYAQQDSTRVPRASILERLRPGATVRLYVRSQPQIGVVQRVSADSIYLGNGAFALRQIDRLEVRQRATRDGLKWGAVFGTAGGAAFGAFLGLIVYAACESDCPESLGKSVLVGTLGGAGGGLIAGGVLGAVVGSALPKWVDISAARTRASTIPRRRIGQLAVSPLVARAHDGDGAGAGARGSLMFQTKHLSIGPEVSWESLGSRDREVVVPCSGGQVCTDTIPLGERVFQAGGLIRLGTGTERSLEPFATIGSGYYSWSQQAGYGSTQLAGYSLGGGVQFRNAARTRSLLAEGRWHSNLSRSGLPGADFGFYTLAVGGAISW